MQSPLLYFGLVAALTMKLFADGVKITNIHGWDIEGSGKLYEVALSRVLFGTLIPHVLYTNQCFWKGLWRTMAVNIFMIVFCLCIMYLVRTNRLARLSIVLKVLEGLKFKDTKKKDVINWVYKFSHPYIRQKGMFIALNYMNELNSPVSHDHLKAIKQEPILFNRPSPSPMKFTDSSLKTPFGLQSVSKNGAEAPEMNKKKFSFSNIKLEPTNSQGQSNIEESEDKQSESGIKQIGHGSPGMLSLGKLGLANSALFNKSVGQSLARSSRHFKHDRDDDEEENGSIAIEITPTQSHNRKKQLAPLPHHMLFNVPELVNEEEGVSPSHKGDLAQQDGFEVPNLEEDQMRVFRLKPRLTPPILALNDPYPKPIESSYEESEKDEVPIGRQLTGVDLDDIKIKSLGGTPYKRDFDNHTPNINFRGKPLQSVFQYQRHQDYIIKRTTSSGDQSNRDLFVNDKLISDDCHFGECLEEDFIPTEPRIEERWGLSPTKKKALQGQQE